MTELMISSLDRARLGQMFVRSAEFGVVDRRWLFDLEHRIEEAACTDSHVMPDDVVTMNSTVCLRDLATDAREICTVVYPLDADQEQGRVSILDPLAIPLFGKRVGDLVRWSTPLGFRERRIEELIFQPERAGIYTL